MLKTIAIIMLGTYSFLSIFGLVSLHYENNHFGIMTPDCPDTICINLFKEDVSLWKDVSNTLVPISKILSILIIGCLFYRFNTFKVNVRKLLFYIYTRSQLPNSLYQLLFSRGILNSKVF